MNRPKGVLAINAAAVIFGSAALYGRLPVTAAWIVVGRSALAVLGLLALAAARRQRWPGLAGCRVAVAVCGALLAAHWLTFYLAVQSAGIATGTLTFASFPMFTVLLRAVSRRRRPTAVSLGAATMIVGAIGLLTGIAPLSVARAGTLAGLASALLYALYWQMSQPLDTHLPVQWSTALQNAVVCAIGLPMALASGPIPAAADVWLGFLVLGLGNTAVGLALYGIALGHLDATTCSAFVALEPVYAIALAGLLFGDSVPPTTVVAGTLIVTASLLTLWDEARLSARGVAA